MKGRVGWIVTAVMGPLWLGSACPDVEEVVWTSGDARLVGSLMLPRSDEPSPLVVFIAGSGNSDRSLRVVRAHVRRLHDMGFAVFAYDKRGTGDSGGDWRAVDLHQLARDVDAVLPDLMSRSDVDGSRVILMGLSQGAWVSLLANSLGPGIGGLVWLSGAPMTPAEQGHAALALRLRSLGWDSTSTTQAVTLDRLITNVYRQEAGWDSARAAIEAAREEPWFEDAGIGLQDPDSWNWRWYRTFMDYDPVPELSALAIPLFAVYGEQDVLVPANQSTAILDEIRGQTGAPLESQVLPGVGHELREDRDSEWPAEYWTTLETGIRGILARTPRQ
jgi:hypothetical protein